LGDAFTEKECKAVFNRCSFVRFSGYSAAFGRLNALIKGVVLGVKWQIFDRIFIAPVKALVILENNNSINVLSVLF
jgi:hypothetical protein